MLLSTINSDVCWLLNRRCSCMILHSEYLPMHLCNIRTLQILTWIRFLLNEDCCLLW